MNSNTPDIVTGRDGSTMLRGRVRTVTTPFIPTPAASLPTHSKPVLVVVDADPVLRRGLTTALRRRFGADYRVRSAATSGAALATLRRLHHEGADVAMVIADLRLSESSGIEFFRQARECYPQVQCVLLTTIGDAAANESLHRALALGEIDQFVHKPWRSPEEWIYPQVSETLSRWWRAHRPRFERVRVVGPQWDGRSHELRDLGTRNAIPFGFYATDSAEGQRLLHEHGADADRVSILLLVDDKALVDPSNDEIAEVLGLATRASSSSVDVTIVGAGPAGLAAAVYAASEGLQTVVIEPEAVGGQAGTTSMIRNYLGFPRGVSGQDLAARAADQALQFGAQIVYTKSVTGLRAEGSSRIVTLSDGSEIASRAVVLATGVAYRRLAIPALERLVGKGVFYGAVSEARAMRGEEVFVVGAGNSAGQAALHLADYATRVTILVRGDSLAETMSDYLIDEVEATPNVEIRVGTIVKDGQGRRRLEALILEDQATGTLETVSAAALFVLIGAEPRTDWLDGTVQRDDRGYIFTCRELSSRYDPICDLWPRRDRSPFPMETSLPGVFAVGDVRHNAIKRVAAAVGAGATAISSVHAYLAEEAQERRGVMSLHRKPRRRGPLDSDGAIGRLTA